MSSIKQLDLSRNRFRNKFWTRVKGLKAPVKARSKKERTKCSVCTREIVFGLWKGVMWLCL